MTSKRTRPVPVRLDDETVSRIRSAASRMGSNSSSIIRLAITQQLPAIERGVIRLNPIPSPPTQK